jgi:hypothetical protein
VRSSVAGDHECSEAVEFEWRALLEGEEAAVVHAPLSIDCVLSGGREKGKGRPGRRRCCWRWRCRGRREVGGEPDGVGPIC